MRNKHLSIQDTLFKLTHPLIDTSLSWLQGIWNRGGGGGGRGHHIVSVSYFSSKTQSNILAPRYLQVPSVFIVVASLLSSVVLWVWKHFRLCDLLCVCVPSPFLPPENEATTYLHVLMASMCRDDLTNFLKIQDFPGYKASTVDSSTLVQVGDMAFLQQHL